jgi:hypothetical protein
VPTALFYLMSVEVDAPHPSDQYLERVFAANQPEFEKLISMANEDSHVVRIASDFTWLDTSAAWPRPESELGFSNQRWDEYRRLFSKLGLTSGLVNDAPGFVLFFASSKGLVTGGSTKGYAYCATEPKFIVDSLDHPSFKDSSILYKKLKGNWYLFYQVG